MIKRYLTYLAMLFVIPISMTASEINYIFIGNSFTFYHDMPTLVKALLEEGNPQDKVNTEIVAYGGRSPFHHWELAKSYNRLKAATLTEDEWKREITALEELGNQTEAPAIYAEYYKSIRGNDFFNRNFPWVKALNWKDEVSQVIKPALDKHRDWQKNSKYLKKPNYVVVQNWLDFTDDPSTGYFKYAKLFSDVIKEMGATPVYYLTAVNAQNKEPVNEAPSWIKDEAVKTCQTAAEQAKKQSGIVVPVILAAALLQDSKEPIARTLTLRYTNDFHPNNTMAYLTSCVFYGALTGKSPEGLKFNKVSEGKEPLRRDPSLPSEVTLDDATRSLLQRTAWKAVEMVKKGEFESQ